MAILRIPVRDEEGNSVWPAKFTEEELEVKKQMVGGDLRFEQQYMINPIALTGTELSLEWLHFYDEEIYQRNEGEMEYFFGVDPSISGTGDYMAICVVSKGESGKVYIEDIVREQANLERGIALLERTALIYQPIAVVNVEAIQGQDLLVQDLQDRTTLPIRSYYPGNKMKKQDRIKVMAQVYFQSKKALLRGHKPQKTDGDPNYQVKGALERDDRMAQFILEWVGFPRMKNDDCLDAAGAALDAAMSAGIAASISSDADQPTPYEQRQYDRWRRWGL